MISVVNIVKGTIIYLPSKPSERGIILFISKFLHLRPPEIKGLNHRLVKLII